MLADDVGFTEIGARSEDSRRKACGKLVKSRRGPDRKPGTSTADHEEELHACNSKISLEFKEVDRLATPQRRPIWRFPEPPIEFLLVGTRGNADQGKESPLQNADVAQLVEHHLAKVDVASSNLVVRSQDTVTAKVLFESALARWVGREARQRPAKPYTRVRIPYPPR